MAAIVELLAALSALLGRVFIAYIIPVAVKLMLGFGIAVVTYNVVAQPFVAMIQNALGGAGAQVIQILAGLQFDKAITAILSAHAFVATKRLVLQRSGP